MKALPEVWGEMLSLKIAPSLACANQVLSALGTQQSDADQDTQKTKTTEDQTQVMRVANWGTGNFHLISMLSY